MYLPFFAITKWCPILLICVDKLIFNLHPSIFFLLWQDIQSNDIAYYHNMLPQMNTNHIEKRGKVRTWTNGRILVLGWLDLCKMSKIRENDTCLCEIVLRDNEAIEMIRVHVVRKEWGKDATMMLTSNLVITMK
jgi:hypothetical protein